MASPGIVFLMYHELELPGRQLIQSEPGYMRYILREAIFRAQIDWLRKERLAGLERERSIAFNRGKLRCHHLRRRL